MQSKVLFVSIVMLAVTVGMGAALAAGAQDRVSEPFAYSGYSSPEYTSSKTFSAYVPMPDGVKIAVDVHLPEGGPERTAFPVILEYVPYQRSTINPETGDVRDAAHKREGKFYLSYGYALVVADMRGTGTSSGWNMDFMPQLGSDGAKVVDWIADQAWCNGKVGMKGSSYLGWSQLATASHAPEALKCIVPQCIPLDGYTGEAYPGGIYLQGFLNQFSEWMPLITRNFYLPGHSVYPTKPVVDEDGDGELADEVPVDVNGNGTFLDDGFPPTYRDGTARKDHVYFKATLDHEKDYDYAAWASVRPFIDTPTPLGISMYDLSPGAFVPGVAKAGIPVYHLGGWFDAFTRGSMELYCTMAKTNPSKLAMAPSYHDFPSGPFWKHFGVDDPHPMYFAEHLRFFDHYLKGIDNGIDAEAPIALYVMNGGGWRPEKEWPLARQVLSKYYFADGNGLGETVSPPGSDIYKGDLTHDSSYTDKKGNRYVGIGMQSPKTPPIRGDKDKQSLIYTTPPLAEDTEVTGHPIVRFWASSTSDDADFFVYLSDVDEEGNALLVTEGQLRAGFAALHDNDAMIQVKGDSTDVLPDLPWHGFEKGQYNKEVFAGGAKVEIVIDFNPTAWVFKKGHQLRVSIACADFPTFRLNPILSPSNDPTNADNTVPTITVYRDAEHPSHVEIPVIPVGK